MTAISKTRIWRLPPAAWASVIGALALAFVFSFDTLKHTAEVWSSSEEYSYAYAIPVITLFFIWQKRNSLEQIPFAGSWLGVVVIALGGVVYLLGELSTIYAITQYSLLIIIIGTTLSFTGWYGIRPILVPLLFLAFMIPLPSFLYNNLSAQLQLISSQIGVALIHLFGISVYLEGNVIDLGSLKLEVAEACNGLRYLFPLMALAFIAAYFFKGAIWKRALIFLSAIPITIAMNGFRIAAIGVMAEYGSRALAEGVLHDVEAWAVFMVCTAALVLEMWVLAKVGSDARPLRDVFGLQFPAGVGNAHIQYRSIPRPFWGAVAVLVVMTVASATLPKRAELLPERTHFYAFPMEISQWRGKFERLDDVYIDALKFDDYILADFMDPNHRGVNLYVAYYASQKKGQSAHSPRSCMPGGGWEITSLTQREIDGTRLAGRPLTVNRAVIEKGDKTQLVYYWFLQRGRVIDNEYAVKWYLFWDALTRNRTDGALVRLIAAVKQGERLEETDRRLAAFASAISPHLASYVPD